MASLQQLCVKFILDTAKCSNPIKNIFLNLDDIDYYRILKALNTNRIYNFVFSIELFLKIKESRRLDYLNLARGQDIMFHESLFQASYCRFMMNHGMLLIDGENEFCIHICMALNGDFADITECFDRCLSEYHDNKLKIKLLINICSNNILNSHEKATLIGRFDEVDIEINSDDD
jgi:hypothetical protein